MKYNGLMLPTYIKNEYAENARLFRKEMTNLSWGEMKSLFTNEKRNVRHLLAGLYQIY